MFFPTNALRLLDSFVRNCADCCELTTSVIIASLNIKNKYSKQFHTVKPTCNLLPEWFCHQPSSYDKYLLWYLWNPHVPRDRKRLWTQYSKTEHCGLLDSLSCSWSRQVCMSRFGKAGNTQCLTVALWTSYKHQTIQSLAVWKRPHEYPISNRAYCRKRDSSQAISLYPLYSTLFHCCARSNYNCPKKWNTRNCRP